MPFSEKYPLVFSTFAKILKYSHQKKSLIEISRNFYENSKIFM